MTVAVNPTTTLADVVATNDLLRTQLKGGLLLYSPEVLIDFPTYGLRGRLVSALADATHFFDDEHSSGCFSFGGRRIFWKIEIFAGERSISLFSSAEV